jgi:hypothetical protein
MGGLAERDAVQGVGTRSGRERADHGVGQPGDNGVEGVSALDALSES